jgi:sulfite exporter TauE/SafE
MSAYQLLSAFGIISFSQSVEATAGLGAIFLIGITASFSSCLAMVGGLLLSVSARAVSDYPNATRLQKITPLLHFNAGRLIGYFVFGGLTGLLGKALILNVQTTGIVKVVLSVLMIWLGLNILHIIPKRFCRIPLPKAIMKRIHALSNSGSFFAPILLGAATFFVPCGFTQSMQLLALASGSFNAGATIMLMFALGTLPALLGISMMSSFSSGTFGRVFTLFAGSLSVILGISNLQGGLQLTGIDIAEYLPRKAIAATNDPNVSFDKNGQQIISVLVHDSGYSSYSYNIKADIPTWIYATAPQQLSGCISAMAIPSFNISQPIHVGPNWIGPLKPTKDFAFMCSMGMFKASVHVQS